MPFKKIKKAVGGAVKAFGGDILGAGLGYASARQAQQQSERFYRNRHQWEVEDLRKAGLNPILSAKFGGGGVPSMAQAQVPQIGSSASKLAQSKLTNAQLSVAKNQSNLLNAQTMKAEAEANSAWSNASLSKTEEVLRRQQMDMLKKNPKLRDAYQWMKLSREAGLPASSAVSSATNLLPAGQILNMGRSIFKSVRK